MKHLIAISMIAGLALTGCKKKQEEAPAAPAATQQTTPMPEEPAPKPVEPAAPTATGTIVDVAMAAGSFKTLLAAVEAAGLVETLQGPGPFTVFAPTDEAFAKIPKADLDALLADKAKLSAVLTYHVVPGKVMAKDVTGLSAAKTVNGQELKIDTTSGVKIDNATVIKTDIEASNGVIHVIDAVMLPK